MLNIELSLSLFFILGMPYLFLLKKAGLSPLWSSLFLITPLGLPLGAWIAFPMLALRAWPARGEVANSYFLAVPQNILLALAHVFLPVFSFYVIFKKTGYSGWWCLSLLVFPIAITMLWIAAFKDGTHYSEQNA